MRLSKITRSLSASAMALSLCFGISACGDDTHKLSKAQFVDMGYSEEYWPWTSDDTTVKCVGNGRVVMEIDGTDYPLNGRAKEFGDAEGDLNDVWIDNPDVDGLKIDASDYDHVALGYCGIDAPALNDPS